MLHANAMQILNSVPRRKTRETQHTVILPKGVKGQDRKRKISFCSGLAVGFWKLLKTARRKDKDAWYYNSCRKGSRETRCGQSSSAEGSGMHSSCKSRNNSEAEVKCNHSSYNPSDSTTARTGLWQVIYSVIYNLKSESPNRKITACQCKWWCLQRPPASWSSRLQQPLSRKRNDQPGQWALLSGGRAKGAPVFFGDGWFLWLTSPGHLPEQEAQTPNRHFPDQ